MSRAQTSSKTAPKNISVYCRVRPPVSQEKGHTFENITFDPRDNRAIVVNRKSGTKMIEKRYMFNRVFQPSVTQKDVYDTFARGAVEAAFDGQHGVLFVYGQTGSGKTFTISNDDPKNEGVLQQAMKEIWGKIAADKENDYDCSVSYVQLYNEILTDLLDEQKARVRIQIGSEGRGDVVMVADATGLPIERPVKDYKSTMDAFKTGMSRKEMASTSMNNTSSRSHTVFTLNINKSRKTHAVEVGAGGDAAVALEGRLVLCDLAGSERVSKTHAEGKTLDEATHINRSLLTLGKVVAALTENAQHAPFRESKLTRILQYSLMGNGNTSLVVNISPSDENVEESLSAILFGQRASQIKQDAKRHEVLDYKALYLQLMADLDNKNDKTLEDALEEERGVYEDRISALNDQIKLLTEENTMLRNENGQLRAAVPADKLKMIVQTPASQVGGGAANGAAAGATGGGGVSGGNSWAEASLQLREMINLRDAKLRTISDERVRLALLLSEEQRKCFKLAQKMQAFGLKYKMERSQLTRRQDELAAELAASKGTDYLSAVTNFDMLTTLSSPRMPRDGEEFNDLEKAQAQIRAFRAERQELIVYQAKAATAIRMLVKERDAALRKAGLKADSN
ncbi:putative kinesin [Leptomonas pyrrhocoris]|uniref:Kinesin-like protein n=1 Tax=Leptomonas pyrrhocoris TaxID=157538 RepID=A0A0M9G5X3_LEPPY|nr:putative kinesin [Leptomonas pyrrhocoris]XP_015661446.1 putative kinesin [Leptomonas pyrrhocoris]KPA83006.1 putative kinesin [Leptomonas pyrrhocoris]KPA83007.1 putative kinesin [Leptomonas pyrrhocoris]|eukprot:XP_015661445.1 putative kinesin [Leptomonas pyrrhocoris]